MVVYYTRCYCGKCGKKLTIQNAGDFLGAYYICTKCYLSDDLIFDFHTLTRQLGLILHIISDRDIEDQAIQNMW